jgi:uncharacterized protein YbjT (DUF2867 family)
VTDATNDGGRVLLTGATGYVGGRLIAPLEEHRPLRCLTRRPEALAHRVGSDTEIAQGDVRDPAALARALEGVECALYLIHSMAAGGDYREADKRAALAFGRAAREAGVRRIVYLGGLGEGGDLSKHLISRHEVGEALAQSGVPVIELRASLILGSGSLSWEMVRALVDRLPVMITPRWVGTPTQPIAIEDVIAYLIEAVEAPPEVSGVYEIGGSDVVGYGEIMSEYARQRGLRRVMIPVPVLTPYLSGLWLGLVTPIYARVGRELVEGLRNPTVVRDDRALTTFGVVPRSLRQAIERALRNEDHEFAQTRWSDALSSGRRAASWGGERFGNRLVDARSVVVATTPERAFAPVRRIGGDTGWYYANRLWQLRGLIDLSLSGVGLRRGRRDPENLVVGDTVDWWRVEAYEPPRLLRLRAEMRLPGRAWLQFEVEPHEAGARITQTAVFDPVGVVALAYWYGLWPFHEFVFRGMLRNIARAALAR